MQIIRLPWFIGRRFELADFQQLCDDLVHHLPAFVDVGQFAAAEDDGDEHLVLVLEKALRLLDLELDVVIAGLGAEADFLDLGVVRRLVATSSSSRTCTCRSP